MGIGKLEANQFAYFKIPLNENKNDFACVQTPNGLRYWWRDGEAVHANLDICTILIQNAQPTRQSSARFVSLRPLMGNLSF